VYPVQNISKACKSLIQRLLHKDEYRRLGSRAGASDIKSHAFFKPINFALLRHMTPPIIPEPSRGIDAINFRNIKESRSFDIFSTYSEKEENEELANTDNAGLDPFANFSSGRLRDFDNECNFFHLTTLF
jgi:protein-serine/threonine kinase